MTVLEDFLSKLIFRRPPLLRWTPLKGALAVYAELLRIHYTKFIVFRKFFWKTFGSTIKKIKPFFKFNVEKDIRFLFEFVKTGFELMLDNLYNTTIENSAQVGDMKNVLSNIRMQQHLQQHVFGMYLGAFLQKPFKEIIIFILDQVVLRNPIMNNKFSNYLPMVETAFAKFKTRLPLILDNLHEFKYAKDILVAIQKVDISLRLISKITRALFPKKYHIFFAESDFLVGIVKSILVIPHELSSCVLNEMQVQAKYDKIYRKYYYHWKEFIFRSPRKRSSIKTIKKSTFSDNHTFSGYQADPKIEKELRHAKQKLHDAEQQTLRLTRLYK